MKKQRKLFLSGFSGEVPLLMHCVSRIVDRQYLLKDEEREVFVNSDGQTIKEGRC